MMTAANTFGVRRTVTGGLLALGVLAAGIGIARPAAAASNMTLDVHESVGTIGVGETMQYTFTVKNTGDFGTANVSLNATLQNGTILSIAQSQPAHFQGIDQGAGLRLPACTKVTDTRAHCTGGFFDRGDSSTVTVTVKAPAEAGTMQMSGSVTSGTDSAENPAGNADSETTQVIVRPDLTASILSGTDALGSFANGSYRVQIKNAGGSTASHVTLRIQSLSGEMDFHSADIQGDAHGFDCHVTQQLSFLTPTVECTGGTLAAGASMTISVSGSTTFVAGSDNGTIRATADPDNTVHESNENNNKASLTVHYN